MPRRRLASSRGPQLGRIGLDDGDRERAVGADRDRVGADVLLPEHTGAVVDTELPVVPGARQQVAVERALSQPVALVRAGVVEGEHAVGRADQAEPPAVDRGPSASTRSAGRRCGDPSW